MILGLQTPWRWTAPWIVWENHSLFSNGGIVNQSELRRLEDKQRLPPCAGPYPRQAGLKPANYSDYRDHYQQFNQGKAALPPFKLRAFHSLNHWGRMRQILRYHCAAVTQNDALVGILTADSRSQPELAESKVFKSCGTRIRHSTERGFEFG